MSDSERRSEQIAEIAVLRAIEVELLEGSDPAIAALGPPRDEIKTRGLLSILLRAERVREAADLVRNRPPEREWSHLAAQAFASIGDLDAADKVLQSCKWSADLFDLHRAIASYAEGAIYFLGTSESALPLLAARVWSDEQRSFALRVLDKLNLVLSPIQLTKQIQTEVGLRSTTSALVLSNIAGNPALTVLLGDLLASYIPVPLALAEVCLRRLVELPEGLTSRLRLEHPRDFNAHLLAAVIEMELLNEKERALQNLSALARNVTTDTQRDSVAAAIFEAAVGQDVARMSHAEQLLRTIRPNDNLLPTLLTAVAAIDSGNAGEANVLLEGVRDEGSSVWWQTYAQVSERQGQEENARLAWERASELLPHPDVLRRSVRAALDVKAYQSAARSLTLLLKSSPDDAKATKALAHVLHKMGDYEGAADYLRTLAFLSPNDPQLAMELASCLAKSAQLDAAVTVLRGFSGKDTPLELIMMLSQLLSSSGREKEGLDVLIPIADDHWSNPAFLLFYMTACHAAGDEARAGKALVRVEDLRRSGRVPTELLQVGNLEDLLRMGEEYRRRRDSLQLNVLQARLVWLLADDCLGSPAPWAWTLRTQVLDWVLEEPLNITSYCVYATNSFCRVTQSGQSELVQISSPKPGDNVVIDISALLTLFHLELLTDAAKQFGTLLIPSTYGDFGVKYGDKLGPHQPSREAELMAIKRAIENRRVSITDERAGGQILIDEFSSEPDDSIGLLPALRTLQAAQRITQDDLNQLAGVLSHNSASRASSVPVDLGSVLVVQLSTLRAIALSSTFAPLTDSYDVRLTASDRHLIDQELAAFSTQRQCQSDYYALWSQVRELLNAGLAQWVPVPLDSDEDDAGSESLFLDALKVAHARQLPLLADDRVLHAIIQSGTDDASALAFSTDVLVMELFSLAADDQTRDRLARSYEQLMEWRYRFLIPSADLLYHWAKGARAALPGPRLIDASLYMHTCMRDPGMLCGPEKTDPPMPIAFKYVYAWTEALADLVARVWQDAEFSDEQAILLTNWICTEGLPSVPRGLQLQGDLGPKLARLTGGAFLGNCLLKMCVASDFRRANEAMWRLAGKLGIGDRGLVSAVITLSQSVEGGADDST